MHAGFTRPMKYICSYLARERGQICIEVCARTEVCACTEVCVSKTKEGGVNPISIICGLGDMGVREMGS